MKQTIIDLIRHGEPVGGQRLRGSQDDPLSDLGWQQMRSSVGEYSAWNNMVSSPLKRCRHFAEELNGRLNVPLAIVDDFREIGFGEWEGRCTKEMMTTEPEALKNYWQNPDEHTPPGGERLCDFVERIHGAWAQLVDDAKGEHTLLVCHGGVVRAVLTAVLGMPRDKLWNFDVPYANATRVVYHHFDDGTHTAQLRFHQASFHQGDGDR